MNPLYRAAQRTTLAKFQQFGQAVTLVRQIKGEYDPITGESSGGEVIFSGWAMLSDYDGETLTAHSLIQTGDKKIKIAALALEHKPKIGDTIKTLSGDFLIKAVKEINPAGLPILYEVQGRR